MLRLGATLAVIILMFVCFDGDRRASTSGTLYQLVSIGGKPLAVQCSDDELRASRYELFGNHWLSVETVFKDCTDSRRSKFTRVRKSSGVFSLRGDTIEFESPNTNLKLGEARVVLMGLLRNDTLTVWRSDVDGGDYVFVRQTP